MTSSRVILFVSIFNVFKTKLRSRFDLDKLKANNVIPEAVRKIIEAARLLLEAVRVLLEAVRVIVEG
jgi:hypothetical protein